jgi:hypothetical protein
MAKHDQWVEESYAIDHRVWQYENNEVALTKKQVEELYAERTRLLKACPHLSASHYRGSWSDSGYGLDRHYATEWIECDYCKKHLDGGDRGEATTLLRRGPWDDDKKQFR